MSLSVGLLRCNRIGSTPGSWAKTNQPAALVNSTQAIKSLFVWWPLLASPTPTTTITHEMKVRSALQPAKCLSFAPVVPAAFAK